jgi:hypothetical protein
MPLYSKSTGVFCEVLTDRREEGNAGSLKDTYISEAIDVQYTLQMLRKRRPAWPFVQIALTHHWMT